jgi:hypothetical protein
MARPTLPDMSPWRRQPLTIPPDSLRAWIRLALWEGWMGILLGAAVAFGARLIAAAPDSIVTLFDFTNCYAAPPVVEPCERIVYRAGLLNMVFNIWCGLLVLIVAAWLVWDLWNAVAPKPITDDFLKLLDDSFGRDWRKPRTWPWVRAAWAYGFTLGGAALALGAGMLISSAIASPRLGKPPAAHVDTSERFRSMP